MFEDIKDVLLITDMDGTFLPSCKIPGQRSLKAIEDFQKKGGKFSIATGRALQAAQQYFDTFTVNCPAVLCNGGMVYDINNKKQINDIYVPTYTKEIVKTVLKDNPDVGCEVLTLDAVYVPQMTPMEQKHNEICKVIPVRCPVDEIKGEWYKVLFAIEPEKMDRLISYVSAHNWSGVDFVRSAHEYYEILPQNISKGAGINAIRNEYRDRDLTIVAVGDYNNDIEMLEAADLAVCPSNAVEEVKKVADVVLGVSCEEDAIAAVIDLIYSKLK